MSFHPFDVVRRVLQSSYDVSTQAVINTAIAQGYSLPSNLLPLDNLIRNLKSISSGAFWNSRDTIYLSSIIENTTTHNGLRKINLKNPSGQERVFFGALTLNSYGGIQGNGINAYIDHVSLLTDYVNYKQNDAGIVAVKSLNIDVLFSSASGTVLNVLLRGNSGVQRLNSVISTNGDTSGIGTIGIIRSSSTVQSLFNNNSKSDLTSASSSVINKSLWQFRNQSSSTAYYAGDSLCDIVGGSYSQTEFNLFRTYFNQYLTESGFSPIA